MSRPYFKMLFALPGLALCLESGGSRAFAQESEPGAIQFGFEERIRNENWNNLFDYNGAADDERHQLRLRSRAWVTVPLLSFVDVHFGVGSESNERLGQPKEVGEVFVEQAYFEVKRLFVKGLSMKVGRQDLVRGDGFIISDATPYDGSRTFYSNALVLAYTRGIHKIELLALSNPARDRYLPRIHSQSRMLQESDEKAAGLYYTARPVAGTELDGYYLLKSASNSIVPRSDSRYMPDRHVTVAGTRASQRFGRWTASAEGGYQFGSQSGNIPIRAWGTSTSLRRVLYQPRNIYASIGYEALSGDDPSTVDRIEGWDSMFARCTKPSELYLYSGMNERGLGNWSNLRAITTEAGIDVGRSVRLKGGWNRFSAPQRYSGNPAIFADGGLRGNNLQLRADFKVRDWWKAHIMMERLLPGDFYSHRTPAWFLRVETSFQFKTNLLTRKNHQKL